MKEWLFDNFRGCLAVGMVVFLASIFYLFPVFPDQPDPVEVKYKEALIENQRLQIIKDFINDKGVTINYNGCEDIRERLGLNEQ